jgi:hypothetical protein
MSSISQVVEAAADMPMLASKISDMLHNAAGFLIASWRRGGEGMDEWTTQAPCQVVVVARVENGCGDDNGAGLLVLPRHF